MLDDQNDQAVFPQPYSPNSDSPVGGLQLRDLFAAHALSAAIQMAGANTRLMGLSDQELSMWAARIAYGAADAMLAAREE